MPESRAHEDFVPPKQTLPVPASLPRDSLRQRCWKIVIHDGVVSIASIQVLMA